MSDSALLKQNVDRHYPTVAYGKGVFLYDTDGKRYLDGSGGPTTASLGHGVPEITTAIDEQLSKVAFTYRTQFTNQPAEDLARRLTDLAPGDLDWAFFVSSGSEATEFAMRAALGYWRELGRPDKVKVLGQHISYHGMTLGALSMSGHAARRPDYRTLLHAFPVGPPAYLYRYAHPDETEDEYAERSIAEFEAAVVGQDPTTVAAIIVEPIAGAAGGVLVPPAGYLRLLRDMCDRLDVLLILDEVITGVGRDGIRVSRRQPLGGSICQVALPGMPGRDLPCTARGSSSCCRCSPWPLTASRTQRLPSGLTESAMRRSRPLPAPKTRYSRTPTATEPHSPPTARLWARCAARRQVRVPRTHPTPHELLEETSHVRDRYELPLIRTALDLDVPRARRLPRAAGDERRDGGAHSTRTSSRQASPTTAPIRGASTPPPSTAPPSKRARCSRVSWARPSCRRTPITTRA